MKVPAVENMDYSLRMAEVSSYPSDPLGLMTAESWARAARCCRDWQVHGVPSAARPPSLQLQVDLHIAGQGLRQDHRVGNRGKRGRARSATGSESGWRWESPLESAGGLQGRAWREDRAGRPCLDREDRPGSTILEAHGRARHNHRAGRQSAPGGWWVRCFRGRPAPRRREERPLLRRGHSPARCLRPPRPAPRDPRLASAPGDCRGPKGGLRPRPPARPSPGRWGGCSVRKRPAPGPAAPAHSPTAREGNSGSRERRPGVFGACGKTGTRAVRPRRARGSLQIRQPRW